MQGRINPVTVFTCNRTDGESCEYPCKIVLHDPHGDVGFNTPLYCPYNAKRIVKWIRKEVPWNG